MAILGPSGSGKTTLLNIIGGLDRYDEGDLIIQTKKDSPQAVFFLCLPDCYVQSEVINIGLACDAFSNPLFS